MDSGASDGFYSHFPSYSQQPTRREALARARQLDYQTFLSRVSPSKCKSDGKAQKRHTTNDGQSKRQKIPTKNRTPNEKLPKLNANAVNENNIDGDMQSGGVNKDHYLDELEKMELPDILNEQTINVRNLKLAEDKRLRSIRYQQDLMEQIEQKRREKELRRAKELAEEDKLTKRMEEQLKMVRLQDELESQRQARQREQKRINVELNKPTANLKHPKPPTTVRSEPIEPNIPTYRSYDERNVQTDRGKENFNTLKRNDKEIYNFFTNSANNENNHLKDNRYSHYFDLDEFSENDVLSNSMSSSYNTYPSKSNRHHQHDMKQTVCIFCKHKRFLTRSQEENIGSGYICGSCENEPICLYCRKEICVQCKRPTHSDDKKVSSRLLKQRNTGPETAIPNVKHVRVRTESFQQLITDEDDSNSDLSFTDYKPYSFNIDETSVFHPSKSRLDRKLSVSIKNGEVFVQPNSFDELRRITEEKMLNLTKKYGEMRPKKPTESNELKERGEQLRLPTLLPDSRMANLKPIEEPRPVFREETNKLIEFAKELERGDNNAFKRTERKQQIPIIQINKTVIQDSDTNTSTLTQIGAFKKHLQLDKLNF